jgi:methyl acetate hydrolase
MIAAVTGVPFGQHLQEAVLEPLGMNDTVFRRSDDQRRRSADVSQRTVDGLGPGTLDLPEEAEFANAGGGLYSTVDDYATFLEMMLGMGERDGVRILSPDTVAEIARNQIGSLPVPGWKTTQPELSHDVDLFPGIRKGWGLGALITEQRIPKGRAAGSLTWAGIANTYYWLDLTSSVAGVFMTQVLPFYDESSMRAFAAVERIAYAQS